jgi:hypothetical protein
MSTHASIETDPARRALEMLLKFYAMVGNAPEVKGAIAAMSVALLSRATPEQISAALDRCMVECRFPVRLPDIFQRLPGTEAADVNAEKWLAWGIVEKFSSKWLRWNSERTSVYVEKGAPDLAPRILDSVRLSGGWSVFLRMTDEDFPFVQKRFFEAYETWTDIERISDRARLLEIPRAKELVAAKAMPEKRPATVPPAGPRVVLKAIPEPPSPAQLRDRAAVQKQALADWVARRSHAASDERGAHSPAEGRL